jgi:hypothetical protein
MATYANERCWLKTARLLSTRLPRSRAEPSGTMTLALAFDGHRPNRLPTPGEEPGPKLVGGGTLKRRW